MYAFRVVTTTLITIMMLVIGWFLFNTKIKNKASLIGFTAMEIIYFMAIIAMWR